MTSLSSVALTPFGAFAKTRDDYPVKQIEGRDWIDVLSSGQFFVLRQGGTEPPSSSPLVDEKRRGVFVCAGCVTPLFDSTQKFESGTGWPSFAAARSGVEVTESLAAGILGSEVRCGRCGGHLGDVFGDGARFPGTRAAETGRRFCIDGAALVFVPSEEGAAPVVGDGLTGRTRRLPLRSRSAFESATRNWLDGLVRAAVCACAARALTVAAFAADTSSLGIPGVWTLKETRAGNLCEARAEFVTDGPGSLEGRVAVRSPCFDTGQGVFRLVLDGDQPTFGWALDYEKSRVFYSATQVEAARPGGVVRARGIIRAAKRSEPDRLAPVGSFTATATPPKSAR